MLVVTFAIEDKLSVDMLGNTLEAKPEVEMELVLSAFDCGAKIPMTTTKIVHICPIKIFSSFKNCDITFDFSLASSRLVVKRFVHLEINPGRCIAFKVFSRPPYYHNTMATKQKTRDLSFAYGLSTLVNGVYLLGRQVNDNVNTMNGIKSERFDSPTIVFKFNIER